MAPACAMMADMGMVLMIVVVPGLVVLGVTGLRIIQGQVREEK